jgi:hypothetical protein
MHETIDDQCDASDQSTMNRVFSYQLGFPRNGHWAELFDSDVYDNWVNPLAAVNNGGVYAARWFVRSRRPPREWWWK